MNNDLTALSDASRMWATCETEHVSPYFVFMPVNGPQSAALGLFFFFFLDLSVLMIQVFFIIPYCVTTHFEAWKDTDFST